MTFTPFSQIIGQERAINFLRRVMSRDKIPHAYLFVGIPGIGKTTTALALTRAINCREPKDGEGCGQCQSCRQVMSGNFPDLEILKPDGRNIKIGQIRDLNRGFGYKPLSGRFRVSIVQKAEMMTEEAANAFLKTLEEPPQGNILILNVIEPLDLLPTIVSRCQKVNFRPLSVRLIAEKLVDKKKVNEEKALVLAKISEGSLGRATRMCENEYFEKRQEYLFKLIHLPGLSPVEALEMALEYAKKDKKKGPNTAEKGDVGIFDLLSIW